LLAYGADTQVNLPISLRQAHPTGKVAAMLVQSNVGTAAE
jgi:hypothetical protein